MYTTNMVGPGGATGCSVMECLGRAVVLKVYEVAHPYQEHRKVRYQFCGPHIERGFDPKYYPNYELTESRSLT